MALIGYEWLIVVAVILVIFIWGPQKLPELARSIGLAKKEFDKAAAKEASGTAPSATNVSTGRESASDDPLIVAARSLGIVTEGKTKEQIAKEIAEKSPKN